MAGEKSKELPVAGRVIASRELDKAIKRYEQRDDEQGKLITEQLKDAKRLIDGE